jgi:hypothetical protein
MKRIKTTLEKMSTALKEMNEPATIFVYPKKQNIN